MAAQEKSETEGGLPGAEKFLPPLHRALSVALALALLGPGLELLRWLTGCAVAFMGLDGFTPGPLRDWSDYSLRTGMGILLPAALVFALGRPYPFLLRLRECGRAVLIAFFFHMLGFFLVSGLFLVLSGSMSKLMLPRLFATLGPVIMCLLMYLSFRLTLWLLPQPEQNLLRPGEIRLFSLLSALLFFSAALAVVLPSVVAAYSGPLYDVHGLPLELFLLSVLPWGIQARGRRMFRPAFVLVCLTGPLLNLVDLPASAPTGKLFLAVRAGIALSACVLLYAPKVRRWLV